MNDFRFISNVLLLLFILIVYQFRFVCHEPEQFVGQSIYFIYFTFILILFISFTLSIRNAVYFPRLFSNLEALV